MPKTHTLNLSTGTGQSDVNTFSGVIISTTLYVVNAAASSVSLIANGDYFNYNGIVYQITSSATTTNDVSSFTVDKSYTNTAQGTFNTAIVVTTGAMTILGPGTGYIKTNQLMLNSTTPYWVRGSSSSNFFSAYITALTSTAVSYYDTQLITTFKYVNRGAKYFPTLLNNYSNVSFNMNFNDIFNTFGDSKANTYYKLRVKLISNIGTNLNFQQHGNGTLRCNLSSPYQNVSNGIIIGDIQLNNFQINTDVSSQVITNQKYIEVNTTNAITCPTVIEPINVSQLNLFFMDRYEHLMTNIPDYQVTLIFEEILEQ
jgi:hypothetical protein